MKKEEHREEWAARVARYKASGQSAAEWCAANNLKPRQLWYWLRKHKNVETPAAKPPRWLCVEVGEQEPNSGRRSDLLIKVGPATIEVRPGFNSSLFSDVVRTLASL